MEPEPNQLILGTIVGHEERVFQPYLGIGSIQYNTNKVTVQ